jgi:hypothetical protein
MVFLSKIHFGFPIFPPQRQFTCVRQHLTRKVKHRQPLCSEQLVVWGIVGQDVLQI